jgi:GMP synthase (glutamine-hydrolysing)
VHLALHDGRAGEAVGVLTRARPAYRGAVKPFVLLATRAEDLPADAEYALFLRRTGLDERHLVRVRLEAAPMPELDLDELSGIFVGGGPFNASDPPGRKSPVQHRVEAEFATLLDKVVARDFPFLGACYGVGTLGAHQGATIDRAYAEPISVVPVTLTDAGASDPLLSGMPQTFNAFVGHKEAIRALPASATLLGSSPTCPVQMFRVGTNVYATQFHPELDLDGIVLRIHAYADHDYFAADELDLTLAAVRRGEVSHPSRMLRTFVDRYAR